LVSRRVEDIFAAGPNILSYILEDFERIYCEFGYSKFYYLVDLEYLQGTRELSKFQHEIMEQTQTRLEDNSAKLDNIGEHNNIPDDS